REQLVEVVQPLLDADDLGRLLVDEVLAEPILAVHLQDEPAEVADPLLAQPHERAPLAAQLARRRQRSPARGRRLLVLLRGRLGAHAQAVDERRHRRPNLTAVTGSQGLAGGAALPHRTRAFRRSRGPPEKQSVASAEGASPERERTRSECD